MGVRVVGQQPVDLAPQLARQRAGLGGGAQLVARLDPLLLGAVAGRAGLARAAKHVVERGCLVRDGHAPERIGRAPPASLPRVNRTETPATTSAMEEAIRHLASFERESASDGERRAAEWIAERLRACGLDARVEEEEARGGFWWPLGVSNAASAAAAALVLRGPRSLLRRLLAACVGAVGAAAIWDDTSAGRLWLRKLLLPRGSTWNMVAEAGERDAPRTLVLVAHHDAAHTGAVYNPAAPRIAMRLFGPLFERAEQTVPIIFGVFSGPLLTALGALVGRRGLQRAGLVVSAGATAAMADIGRSPVVPGANDNLTAVGVLVGLAERLRERPVEGLRVVLVSTGSEESFMEGMHGFVARHEHELPRESTEFVALECLGSSDLVALDGEGMLAMRRYDEPLSAALRDAAAAHDIPLVGPYKTVAATDALVPLRRGWRSATLASIDDTKLPRNYHWPNDVPDELDYRTLERALTIVDELVRARARGG